MKPTRMSPFVWLVAAISLLFSGAVWAQQPLTITNPDFEQPAVAEGTYNQAPSGWNAYGSALLGTDVYAYNPSTDDFTLEAPSEDNVVGVYDATNEFEKGLQQTLSALFQEGDSYLLTVKVGYTAIFGQVPGYKVQLLAGNTVIAEDDDSLSQGMSFGEFVTSTVEYEYDPGDSDLIGQQLKIRLINKGLVDFENEVAFDDVQLFAVLANPFANANGPYFLPNPDTFLSLDASGSLPSGISSITFYEWDVDNDGDFDENITGITPAAISFSDLQNTYGMVDGSNTIRMRVTDSSGKTAIAETTVELVTSTKYTGPNTGNTDTWNNVANWDNGLPEGELDVVVQTGKTATAWSNSTPNYIGNLTLENNSRLTIGWTAILPGSYNALGTPGFTKIIMNPGSSIATRMGGTPIIPEIQLLANVYINLGTSTQGGAQAQFNYPINGLFQFQLQGNNQGSCVANLNATNSFSTLLASGSEGGLTIRANTSGSLGLGDVTLALRDNSSANYAILEINAANAMADTGTLSIRGNGATLLRMNANDTIANFFVDGVQQAPGTYGSNSSSASNKRSWITGTGILTVATPPAAYWDINGTTVGAGGTAPAGTWNASNTLWNTSTAGTGSVAAWTPGHTAIFSAGSDATGTYAVDVVGSQDFGGMIIRNGSVSLNQGAGGALRLTSDGNINVVSGSTSIAIPINQSATRTFSKSGSGTLALSGNLSQTGGTTLLGGNLVLSGNNSAATGNTTVSSGVLRVDSASAIPGITKNVTINSSGTLVFGPSFGSSNIQTALNNRIVTSSAGTIVADNNVSADFNLSTAGLTAAYFGALSNVNYTGILTPQGNVYRLAGDGGVLTMANTNALTSARSLISRGNVVLASGNNYTGSTTVSSNSSLSLLGSTTTSGITLESGTILTVGNNSSLGIGTLTLSGTTTLKAVGTVVTTNDVAANTDFIVAGTGTLTLGPTTINANRIITNRSLGTATFSSITRNLSNNHTLTINGSGNTTVTGNLTLGTGTLTKNDGSTLTLQGTNTYGATTINGGVLRLEGSVSGAAVTTINGATLQLGGTSNGGLASGDITFNNASAAIQAVSADREISNNIILNNNAFFSGSRSLTVNGTLTNSGANRTLTNNISSGKALVLGAVNLSNDATNRTMTIASSGSTVITGVIANGGTSSASNLVKSGSGTLILNNTNTYGGTTTVNANGGKLIVNGSTGSGNLSIGSGATLGGTGTIGGNTTIAAGGLLEFNLSSTSASQDKLELAAGKSLTFSGTSVLNVTGAPSVGAYVLVTAPGGINGSAPTFTLPDGWIATLSKVGNDLVLNITFIENATPAPTLVSITDDKSGGPVNIQTPVTFTVTFDQDMDINTISAGDFGNAGTAVVSFGAIAEPTPGVITIQATATTAGTLQLRINPGASLRSAVGVNLNTSSALLDDTIIQVEVPALGFLAVSSGDFSSSGNLQGPFSPVSKQYTLLNFGSQSLNWTAGNTAAWITLSSTGGTLASGASTTVTATINGEAAFLPIATQYDTITFTNTTNNQGNTTRGVNLTVNGLPASVTLGGLNQTYDGTPKSVSVTTDPPSLDYSITYNGLAELPTNGGEYDVVATITDPGYSGSASGTLEIAKVAQTINFAALDPVGDDETTLVLTATASSGLPVSFSSSNSEVATVSDDIVTIIDVGTTTITASQPGNENYLAATVVARELSVFRANPLAVPGGPYLVQAPSGLLQLNGSNSLLSANGDSITLYEWDLNSNDNGGVFNTSVTGATPTSISATTLLNTWGMSSGTNNTIRLRVTDSATKTSTASTTVFINAPLVWDANNTGANRTDGGGAWLNANQWWNGTANISWISGSDAQLGNGGSGGGISLPAPTSVGSLTFNTFTGTYTLGTAAQAITINGGINKTATSSAVSFTSPIILGASQTWTNLSAGNLNTSNGSNLIDLAGHQLTIDGTGNMNFGIVNQTTVTLKGSGGLIKSSSGRLTIGGVNSELTGKVSINNGVLLMTNNADGLGSGNLSLNGGVLEFYWGLNYLRALGGGANQVQIPGGISGFSQSGNSSTVRLNNNSAYEAVWGSEFFNPSVFVLNSASANGTISLDNRLDLNGANRTVQVSSPTSGAAAATLPGIIRNSSISSAGLIKTGVGRLNLNGANTYDGGTTLQEGILQLGNTNALGSSVGTLTVNGGLLNLNNIAAVTVGNLTGTGGTIANNGAGAITLTIGSGGGTGGNFQGVIANNTNAGAGTLALTKTGSGAITLSGANVYTGATNINQGRLFINGSTAGSAISVANGAKLGGTGTLGGTLTVAAGGGITPGISNNVGTLNVNNNVAVTSGIWDIELNATTPATDLLNIAGNLTLTGTQTLNLDILDGTPNGAYTFATWTGTDPALGTWNVLAAGDSADNHWLGGANLLWDTVDNWSPTLSGSVALSGKNLQLTVSSSIVGPISTSKIFIDPSTNVSLTGPASGGRQTITNLTIGQGLGDYTAALTLQAGGNLNVTGATTVRSDGTLIATAAGLISPTLNVDGGSVTLGHATGNVATANVTAGMLTVNHVGAANLTTNLSGTGNLAGSAAVFQVNVIGGTPTFTGIATTMSVNGGGISTTGGTIGIFNSNTGAGTSTIGSATTITTANVNVGTVNFNSTQANGTLAVTGGTTNIGAGAKVATANFLTGAGTVNGANPLLITNQLLMADSIIAALTGGTSFTAAGTNLVNNSSARTFSLSGGTLSMSAFGSGGGSAVTVTNPSFETDAGTANTFKYQTITGWSGGTGIEQGTSRTFSPAAAPNGNKWAFIQGAQTMSQNITIATDGFYRVSFSYVGRSGNLGPLYVQAQFNTTPATAVLVPSQTAWTTTTSNAVFLTAGIHSLKFVFTNPLGGDRSTCIDNISVTGDSLTNINLPATSAAATASSVLDLSMSAGAHTLASLNLTTGGTTTALSLKNGASLTLNGDASNNAISATGTSGQTASILPDPTSPPSLIFASGKNVSVDPDVALTVQSVISGGALTKIGAGSLNLTGTNTYSGTTTVNEGKLFINGNQSAATGNVSVAANATLGGTGTIGGDANIAASGKLEFNLSTSAGSHDPLNMASGKNFNFSGASELTITTSGGAAPGTYVLVTGGNNITGAAPATLNLPPGWAASVSIVGNELRLMVTVVDDLTPPTLAASNIVDDMGGSPVAVNTLVTYTVTFSEDMNASTFEAADFGNAGTSDVTIGTITETTPGVFTIQATPTTAGTLIFRVNQSVVLSDLVGNNLNTTTAIADNTTISVTELITNPYETWAAGAPFGNDANGDGVANALAWVLGAADPNAAAYGLLPILDAKSDPNFVIYTFRRKDDANEDANTVIAVQYGTTLTANGWSTAVHDGTDVIITAVDDFYSSDPDIDKVEVKLRKSVFSLNGKLFMRLNVAPSE